MAAAAKKVTVDITTGVGTLAFPHIFKETVDKNDKGEDVYNLQLIIPKSQKDDIRALMAAIKKVGEAQWGDNWKKVRIPLRDGDKEKGELTEDGSTKGDKYPERLGCYFINARSNRPVGVYDRQRNVITDHDEVYGGCKVKINVGFYPYSSSGNHGIGAGLNGVQKISDGEPFGSARQTVENMFDLLDEADDVDLTDDELDGYDDEPEEVEEAPVKKAPAKKRAATKPKPKPAPEPEEDDEVDEDEEDLYDDLDD